MKPRPLDLQSVLRQAWSHAIAVKSNFAREYAESVAAAACLGLITTSEGQHSTAFTNTWRLTPRGMRALWTSQHQ